jgi:hypothetical protein
MHQTWAADRGSRQGQQTGAADRGSTHEHCMRQLLSSCDCQTERLLQGTDDNAAHCHAGNKPDPIGTAAVSFAALILRREARAFPSF